jgi:hypothetical protein
MLQFSTLENNAEIICLLSAFSFITSGLNVNMLYWCFSYGTGTGTVLELSMLVVILEATAKNSSRLKHCIEVCDTTHHCLSCSCNTVHFVFNVEGRPSVITNHCRNFNLVSVGQSGFKYLAILFEIVLIVLIPIGEFIHQFFSYFMNIFFRFPDNFNLTSIPGVELVYET